MSPAGRPGTFTAGWRDGAYRRRPRAAELTAGARPLPARWPGAGAISCSDAGETFASAGAAVDVVTPSQRGGPSQPGRQKCTKYSGTMVLPVTKLRAFAPQT